MLCLVGAPSDSSKGALPVEFLKSEYISHTSLTKSEKDYVVVDA